MRDYSIERYATKVIGDFPERFASIELSGVKCLGLAEGKQHYTVDNEDPDSYSVYLRQRNGQVECVGDFTRYTDALQYALELSDDLSLEIYDGVRP